jgi:hypothetical protein
MAKYWRDKIFFLADGGYIYQDEARFFEEDEYDHRSYTIINPTEQDKREHYTIKPIQATNK